MDLNEVLLPGVGLRYEFNTADGHRFGVVARRSGEFEFVLYSADDPDVGQHLVSLTPSEADALAEILGAPRIAERFADLTKEVPGLDAGQVEVHDSSPYAGRPLGDAQVRTRTGSSIVAIVRDEDVIASPTPQQVIQARDVLVVIGTHEGIIAVERIIAG